MHSIKFTISTNFNALMKAQLNSETQHGYKQYDPFSLLMSDRKLRIRSDCKILHKIYVMLAAK
jgi:hypothetical protein